MKKNIYFNVWRINKLADENTEIPIVFKNLILKMDVEDCETSKIFIGWFSLSIVCGILKNC